MTDVDAMIPGNYLRIKFYETGELAEIETQFSNLQPGSKLEGLVTDILTNPSVRKVITATESEQQPMLLTGAELERTVLDIIHKNPEILKQITELTAQSQIPASASKEDVTPEGNDPGKDLQGTGISPSQDDTANSKHLETLAKYGLKSWNDLAEGYLPVKTIVNLLIDSEVYPVEGDHNFNNPKYISRYTTISAKLKKTLGKDSIKTGREVSYKGPIAMLSSDQLKILKDYLGFVPNLTTPLAEPPKALGQPSGGDPINPINLSIDDRLKKYNISSWEKINETPVLTRDFLDLLIDAGIYDVKGKREMTNNEFSNAYASHCTRLRLNLSEHKVKIGRAVAYTNITHILNPDELKKVENFLGIAPPATDPGKQNDTNTGGIIVPEFDLSPKEYFCAEDIANIMGYNILTAEKLLRSRALLQDRDCDATRIKGVTFGASKVMLENRTPLSEIVAKVRPESAEQTVKNAEAELMYHRGYKKGKSFVPMENLGRNDPFVQFTNKYATQLEECLKNGLLGNGLKIGDISVKPEFLALHNLIPKYKSLCKGLNPKRIRKLIDDYEDTQKSIRVCYRIIDKKDDVRIYYVPQVLGIIKANFN